MIPSNLTPDNLIQYLKFFPGCIFLKDKKGRYLYSNVACEHIEQCGDTNALVGKTELEVQKDKRLGRQYYEEDLKLLKEGGSIRTYNEVDTGERTLYYEVNKSAVTNEHGDIIGIIGTVTDHTAEYELSKEMTRQFSTDVITGVYNTKFLDQWLQEENIIFPFSLIVCDCNFLKHINDVFGHETGDQLLHSVGDMFLTNLPENCIPVRVGGDEFLLLCNDTSESQAEEIIHTLTEKAKTIHVGGRALSIAYGYHTLQDYSITFDECRILADKKMYCAKKKMKLEYYRSEGKADPANNEEMFRNLMGQMPVVIFFKDKNCKYQYINAYNEEDLKDKKDTCYGIGLTDIELQKDESLGRVYYEDDLRILETGEGSILTEEIPIKDGLKYYQITKTPVRDEEGEIIGIAGIVMEVSAAKRAFGSEPKDE